MPPTPEPQTLNTSILHTSYQLHTLTTAQYAVLPTLPHLLWAYPNHINQLTYTVLEQWEDG